MLQFSTVGIFGKKSHEILNEERDLLRRGDSPLDGVIPPSRSSAAYTITADEAQGMSIIFRGMQVHQTAAAQCSIYGVKPDQNGRVPHSKLPSIVRKPVTRYSFRSYINRTISSYIRHGNSYKIKDINNKGKLVGLIPMHTPDVVAVVDKADPTRIIQYDYHGKHYKPDQISHTKFVEIDELPVGLSPFEAANVELKGIYDTRNYTRRWLQQNSLPLEGYLKALSDIDDDEAQAIKDAWKAGTKGDEGIAVLPNGVEFEPLFLKPTDLQWVEVQKFDAIQQVRLLGLPASIMMVNVEGSTQVYQNIEQDWIGYTRYGLMSLLLPIEEELSTLAPNNMRIKFNLDALLRSDTLARYQAHAIALGGKPFLTQEEVREIEDRNNTPEVITQLKGGENGTKTTQP